MSLIDSQLAKLLLSNEIDQVNQQSEESSQKTVRLDQSENSQFILNNNAPQNQQNNKAFTQNYFVGYNQNTRLSQGFQDQDISNESASPFKKANDYEQNEDSSFLKSIVQSDSEIEQMRQMYLRDFKQQQKFIGNIRQLREDKLQTQKMMNTKALLPRKSNGSYEDQYFILEESGSLIDDLDINERDELTPRQSSYLIINTSRLNILEHIVMMLWLVMIILLFTVNSLDTNFFTAVQYSYLLFLALPATIFVILLTDIIYEKYIAKLQKSHKGIYNRLLVLLVCLSTSAISFFFIISLFLSNSTDFQFLGFISFIPYYFCWDIIAGFFVYVSPGLLDPQNNIPIYRVIMGGIYIILGFIYPLMLTIVYYSQLPAQSPLKSNLKLSIDKTYIENVPFLIVIFVHVILLIPDIIKINVQRIIETIILLCICSLFILQIHQDFILEMNQPLESWVLYIQLVINISVWILFYIMNFCISDQYQIKNQTLRQQQSQSDPDRINT